MLCWRPRISIFWDHELSSFNAGLNNKVGICLRLECRWFSVKLWLVRLNELCKMITYNKSRSLKDSYLGSCLHVKQQEWKCLHFEKARRTRFMVRTRFWFIFQTFKATVTDLKVHTGTFEVILSVIGGDKLVRWTSKGSQMSPDYFFCAFPLPSLSYRLNLANARCFGKRYAFIQYEFLKYVLNQFSLLNQKN